MLRPGLRSATFNWAIDAAIHEDGVAFGLIGWLVLMALAVFCLVRRRAPPAQRLLAAAALLYLAIFATQIGFNPWVGRLMLPMAVLAAPLLGLVANRPWLRVATLVVALLSVLPVVLLNSSKMVLPPPGTLSVLAQDRLAQQTVIRRDLEPVLRWMHLNVSGSAPVGCVGAEDSWDYPLSAPIARAASFAWARLAQIRVPGCAGRASSASCSSKRPCRTA